MEVLNLIIATMALLVSAVTYFTHDRKLKSQELQINTYQLKKQDEEVGEQKKAVIRASVIKGEKGKRTIKVYNAGKSIAKNVDIKLLGDGDFIGMSNLFPFEFLNPQEGTEMHLLMHMGSPDKLLIELSWTDDYQVNNIHQQMLTL